MRISKKILACVLAALMAVAMMPFSVFADALPTAEVTDITADKTLNTANLDTAYHFHATGDGAAYFDYQADFIVSIDKSGLTSDDLELYGKFADSEWISLTSETHEDSIAYVADYDYYLLRDVVEWPMTYGKICSDVKDFYCGVYLKNGKAVGATVTVKLVVYKGEDVNVIGDVMTYEVPALPTATLTDITEYNIYDVAYKFEANNDGEAFNDYKADFVVSVDKTVSTADVKLFGKMGNDGEWKMFPVMTAEAGAEYYLARDAYEWTPTYKNICDNVKTFSCGVYGAADEATTLTVKLVIYKEGIEPIVIKSFTYDIPAKTLEDTMSITVADDIDLNINVVTDAPEADHVVYTFADPSSEDTSKTKEVTVDTKGDVTSFTVPLAPAQIRDDITATICAQDGSVIREVTTSVANYCNQILGMNDAQLGAKAEELRDLAKATLDYGKAASEYFEYNESAYSEYNIQLEDPTDAINDATEAALAANGGNHINGDYNIVFSGVSYVAKSKPELRFYINTSSVTDIDVFESHLGDINKAISSNIGSAQIASLEKDGSYLLQVSNIDIADFGKQIVVHSYYNDSFVEFTPLTWVKAAIANPNLSDLGKAIGNYYLKAVGYFGENA